MHGREDDAGREAEPSGDAVVYDLYTEGRRALEARDPRRAVAVLERAVEREPRSASLREALARAYYATSAVRRARDEFREAVALNPTDDYAHFGVGRCHERLGDLAAAARSFRLAVAMAPKQGYRDALSRVETRLS